MSTTHRSFRLTDETMRHIDALARHWRTSQAKAIARAVSQAQVEDGKRDHLREVTKGALQDALRKIVRDGA